MTRHDAEEQRTQTSLPQPVPEERGQPEPTDHRNQERPNPSTGHVSPRDSDLRDSSTEESSSEGSKSGVSSAATPVQRTASRPVRDRRQLEPLLVVYRSF